MTVFSQFLVRVMLPGYTINGLSKSGFSLFKLVVPLILTKKKLGAPKVKVTIGFRVERVSITCS